MPFLLAPLVFLIGASLGSYTNVLILRRAWPRGRSICPRCRRTLSVSELLPIISFTWLRARCRACRAPISAQYPIVELCVGLAALVLFSPWPPSVFAFSIATLQLLAVIILVCLFVIDFYTLTLPDGYTHTLLVCLALIRALDSVNLSQTISAAGYGAVLGFGSLLALFLFTKGQGLGFGDVKLMLPLGLYFGPATTLVLLLCAFIAGGLVAAFLLLAGRAHRKTAIPFGPFLAITAIIFILAPALPHQIITFLLW